VERRRKKIEVSAAHIIRLANRFSLLSCDHFRDILDVQQVSIANSSPKLFVLTS
jgi:hypothetical protein